MPKQKNKKKTAIKKKKPAKAKQKKPAVKGKKITQGKATSKSRPTKKKNQKKLSIKKKKIKKPVGRKIPVKILPEDSKESILGSNLELDNKLNSPILPENNEAKPLERESELTMAERITEFEDFDFGEDLNNDFNNIQVEISQAEKEYYGKEAHMTQKQKIYLMYIAVGCIMAVIVSFWALAVKNSLGQLAISSFLEDETQNSRDILDSLEDIKNEFGQIDDFFNQTSQELKNLETESKMKIIEAQLKNDIADKIREQLESSQDQEEQEVNIIDN